MITGVFPVERFSGERTPFYYYDIALLRKTLDTVRRCLGRNPSYRMHYAVKANFNPAILREISAAGFGADCVSGGEVEAALEAGFKPESIVFAGVGKSDEEIILGLDRGIGRFNVESLEEMEVINALALERGKVADVSLRVNPDIGAHTHANITTGLAENKFGINMDRLEEVLRATLTMPAVRYCGLHFHIGSQITDMSDFVALCNRVNDLRSSLLRHSLPVGDINVGGGLGIEYQHPNHLPMADFEAYFNTFRQHLDVAGDVPVHFELGRSIVAPCGSLICKVLYVKEGTTRRFAIVDGSMTELIRPALYHAYHRIENIGTACPVSGRDYIDTGCSTLPYDVVGPVCESSDVFGKAVDLDVCHRGDYIAIRSAGAYGESMASCYNCHRLPGCVFG